MEKYSRVYHFNDSRYIKGSPLIILAGAILKDNETDDAIAQLKFKSISKKVIKAIEVELQLFDPSGDKQDKKVSHEYLDLKVSRDAEFGAKEPIKLPYNNSRSFEASIKKVIYVDGESWTNNKKFEVLKKQEKLSSILSVEEIAYFRKKYTEHANYIPLNDKDLWICICGYINHDKEDSCAFCRLKKEEMMEINFEEIKKESLYDLSNSYLETNNINLIKKALSNFKSLKKYRDSSSKVEKCLEKIDKLNKEQIKAKKKAKKIISIFVIIALLVGIGYTSYRLITEYNEKSAYNKERAEKYDEASELLEKGKYEEAIKIYDKLGNYKESKKQKQIAEEKQQEEIDKDIYSKAEAFYEKGEYSLAYDEYRKIKNYKDSEEKLRLSELYMYVKDFYTEEAEKYLIDENNKFTWINDDETIRKIFAKKWYYAAINASYWQSPNVAVINKDGTGVHPNSKTFKDVKWKAEGGYLYYTTWSDFYSTDKYEFVKAADDVYLLYNVKANGNVSVDYIFVPFDSELSKKLGFKQ